MQSGVDVGAGEEPASSLVARTARLGPPGIGEGSCLDQQDTEKYSKTSDLFRLFISGPDHKARSPPGPFLSLPAS